MREYIAQRLSAMKNPEERALLREVLNDVILPMYEEMESKYAALEKSVRDELPVAQDAYTIYCGVFPRKDAGGKHAYLSPMLSHEAIEQTLAAGAFSGETPPPVETVFCEADHLKCLQIDRDQQILDGAFVIDRERYPFKCRLERTDKYLKQIEELHNTFLRNDIPWTTVNCAYLNKFYDLRLTELIRTPPPGAKISPRQIEVNFGPYGDRIKRGLIPVWNIDRLRVKGEDYPEPAMDAVNYVYAFDTRRLGADCGFLVDYGSDYIISTRREAETLFVVSTVKKDMTWDMFRFRRRQDALVDVYAYPVLSNGRKDSFSARLTANYGTHITTRAEMGKLLDSFHASAFMEFAGMHFADRDAPCETYDMNPFIRDEIRDPAFQKTLVLAFYAKDRSFFLNRDIASFLASAFQAVYPEYRCVGTIT